MILKRNKSELPRSTGEGHLVNLAVVFVHGLGGGRETWRMMVTMLEQEWNYENHYRLHYYHYYIKGLVLKLFGWVGFLRAFIRILNGSSLESCADGLGSFINVNCRDFDGVILVAHSMGGLVSKKYIVDTLFKTHETKVVKLLTYATPHKGSAWAIFGIKKQVRQMKLFNSKFLNQLNQDWSSLRAYEKVNPSYLVGDRDWVVHTQSAAGTDPDPEIINVAGHDHFSIIEPDLPEHVGFRHLFNVLEDHMEIIEYGDEEIGSGLEDISFEDDFEDEEEENGS
ncbi:MAG: lipase family alpha/beta hydrolase [Bacteroidota bacterium]